jgi:large subunit ribosomal protein L15
MPLYRKLPRRGFNNYEFRTEIAVVNLRDLGGLDASVKEIDAAGLAKAGLIRSGETAVKVLGDGEITRALKITAARFSGSAKAKIEKAGGQAIVG